MLIVDDELVNRTLLGKFLENEGERDFAESGPQAISAFMAALAEKKPYDLILLDIMMPEMDGHECLARIRRLEKEQGVTPGSEVKVVMVSALCDQKNVCKAFFGGGADCYLPKPVRRSDLLKLLDSLRQAS